jgi:ABC-type molybdate transport system permease subunit
VLHTVELVLVILLPTAAGYALLASFGAWGRLADWRYRRQ